MKSKPRPQVRPPEPSSIRPHYVSIAGCSAATGIPASLIKFAIRGGCKCRDAGSRISLEPLLRWLHDPARTGVGENWSERLKEYAARLAKVKAEQAEKTSIPLHDAEEIATEMSECMVGGIDRLERELPEALHQRDKAYIRERIQNAFDLMKARVASDLRKLGD